MNIIEKAKRVFKRKPKGAVYFRILLDGHIPGISTDEPAKPWIRVENMTLEEAAKTIPRIDWHTVPMRIREALELGNKCLTVSREEAQTFLEAK